jgi:hypothetical protein
MAEQLSKRKSRKQQCGVTARRNVSRCYGEFFSDHVFLMDDDDDTSSICHKNDIIYSQFDHLHLTFK